MSMSQSNGVHIPVQPDHDDDIEGYPRLARLMFKAPDMAIFRSFRELNMINLLRMQAELEFLEQQLHATRDEDCKGEGQRPLYAKSFYEMRLGLEDDLQLSLLEEIERKLEKYNSALAKMLHFRQAKPPSKEDIELLQTWLTLPTEGNNFLRAPEARIWTSDRIGKGYTDLISLPESELRDPFTELMYGALLKTYHRWWGKRGKKGPSKSIREYEDGKIDLVSDTVSTVVASLTPTLAILVLYFVQSMLVRIVLIIIFTAIFSGILRLFTTARRVEIFSAAAAFAAVEVVFVGSVNQKTS